MREFVALVAVKGNSERVAKKNIRKFHNTNLLDLKLGHLKSVSNLDAIVVSSEDESVLDMARAAGVECHKRDPYYSTSHVPMSEVYTYLASEMDCKNVVWVPVTNPLAEADVYEAGIEAYKAMGPEYDCLVSVNELKEYLFLEGKPMNFTPYPWARSQDLKGVYAINFVVEILPRESMVKWGSLVGDRPYFYVLDAVTARDIDFQVDFDFCEMVYRQRHPMDMKT
ncbi:MAG TPA: hypothetical protein PLJ47_03750 [Candidatus Hydrogenedentes bacterium]|nr:hypothetical protein [Candidatus Hydrogenedentota bacterium]